jgi:hypothetical protein
MGHGRTRSVGNSSPGTVRNLSCTIASITSAGSLRSEEMLGAAAGAPTVSPASCMGPLEGVLAR